jgi:hypothetical protein
MWRAVRIRLRHPPRSLRVQRISAEFAGNRGKSALFASLAAPETGEFEAHCDDFGILSLFRIPLVPRENAAQNPATASVTTSPNVAAIQQRVLRRAEDRLRFGGEKISWCDVWERDLCVSIASDGATRVTRFRPCYYCSKNMAT